MSSPLPSSDFKGLCALKHHPWHTIIPPYAFTHAPAHMFPGLLPRPRQVCRALGDCDLKAVSRGLTADPEVTMVGGGTMPCVCILVLMLVLVVRRIVLCCSCCGLDVGWHKGKGEAGSGKAMGCDMCMGTQGGVASEGLWKSVSDAALTPGRDHCLRSLVPPPGPSAGGR